MLSVAPLCFQLDLVVVNVCMCMPKIVPLCVYSTAEQSCCNHLSAYVCDVYMSVCI